MTDKIVIDFETYYDKDYSLSKMTTEEYLRSDQFEVIGVSVKCNGGATEFFSGDHTQTHLWLSKFDWANSAGIAHNAMFDMGILSWHFGVRPKLILDTLSIARALDGLDTSLSLAKLAEYYGLSRAKGNTVYDMKGRRRLSLSASELATYGEYCKTDSDLTWELLLKTAPRLPASMIRLQDWTIRAFTEPKLVLNKQVIDQELREFYLRKDGLLASIGNPTTEELRSDSAFALLLLALGVYPPLKESPSVVDENGNPAMVYAFAKTDLEFTDLLEHDDERVVALVEARLGLKTSAMESRLKRFHGLAQRGPLPVPLQFAGAMATKRWSGTDKINLQNLPRSTKAKVSALRKAIEAPPGFKMCVADLSQIELRVNCWQSGQTDKLDTLRTGGDVYGNAASNTFGFPVNKKDNPNERFVGKTQELGCGYQCGVDRFWTMLRVDARKYGIPLADESRDFAERAVKAYRRASPMIVKFWKDAANVILILASGGHALLGPYTIADGKVWLPDGTYLYYPNLRQEPDKKTGKLQWVYDRKRGRATQTKKVYGGLLVENITQACAAKFMSQAMLRLMDIKYQDGSPVFHIVGTVHDELILLFREGLDEQWVKDTVRWAMVTPPDWAPDIPLDCEIEIGSNYSDCK